MLKDLSFPFIHTWEPSLQQHWLNHSRILFDNPALSDEHKRLWKWLATTQQSANELNIKCSHSYEQISIAMNQPCLVIHRYLFGLKLMGFIRARLPFIFDVLTNDITRELRKIELCMPSKVFYTGQQAIKEMQLGVILNTQRQEYSDLNIYKEVI